MADNQEAADGLSAPRLGISQHDPGPGDSLVPGLPNLYRHAGRIYTERERQAAVAQIRQSELIILREVEREQGRGSCYFTTTCRFCGCPKHEKGYCIYCSCRA